jgi:flagellar biosynthetic protein FliR
MNFDLSTNIIFGYAVIFARLGSALLFLPGLGETYVSARARLGLGVLLTIIFYPILSGILPKQPPDILEIFIILLKEITIGVFFGTFCRIIMSVMHIAGMKISYMNGLSAATLFDTNQASQGSVIGVFLSVLSITIFFTSGLHYIVFDAIIDSYYIFQSNQEVPLGEFADSLINLISETFVISFKIAAPITVIGLLLYLSAGLISRLMPAVQVFFVLAPLQIGVSFIILMMALSSISLVFLNFFEDQLALFIK